MLPNQRGFTLLELVIVIIILGILSATAIPHYLNIQNEAQIAAVKGKLAATRGGIELAHAKILASGMNTGPDGNNPDWPTLDEVQHNELRLATRPQSLLYLKLVRSDNNGTGPNDSLPAVQLPDMTAGMSDNPAGVAARTLANITVTPRQADESAGWAYYPGNERDTNGRVVDAYFYVDDDRPQTDNIDAAGRIPSEW
ncbi:MAG: prepilin-type N-terminal cleavage/methylation domain-containing protein [Desulfobacteraceae bacterium]|nr:prepilin-type N-terminal cleavage/methylation domain-containing protein [Desulfobacteraceae bacterium]